MSHSPELEAIPTAGSLVGRHLIVREIAKGTVGPLFLARTQNNDPSSEVAVDTLARVIPLPADLPPKDDQAIAEAIWDSANVGHDMILRVADVVAGRGWVTLVHDHHVGSLLSSLHWRAGDVGSSFPSEVAARVALDVLEGLEQSRGLCETNRIPWRPGSIAMGSLYLCGDGRTRALDGQVMAAVMRSPRMRSLSTSAADVAPEMLDEHAEPDERTDVFAVGVVLWQLVTGKELRVDRATPIDDVLAQVPPGAMVPKGLVQALRRALELDPERRQPSLRDLAVELVMGAEKVATYEQVIEFASTLLPFESAFQKRATPLEGTPTAALAGAEGAPPAAVPTGTAAAVEPIADAPMPDVAPPPDASTTSVTAEQILTGPRPQEASTTSAPAGEAIAAEATTHSTSELGAAPIEAPDTATHGSRDTPAPRFLSPFAPLASNNAASSAPAENTPRPAPAAASPNEDPAPPAAGVAAAGAARAGVPPNSDADHSGLAQQMSGSTAAPDKRFRLEQISWPDEDAPLAAPAVGKSNGKKTAATGKNDLLGLADSDPRKQSAKSNSAASEDAAVKQSVPSTKLSHRDSTRPSAGAKSATPTTAAKPSSRTSTRPVEAQPPENVDSDPSAVKPSRKGGLQISLTTLILGFSTTVLAVVLIMMLLQHRSSPLPASALPATPAVAPPAQQQLAAEPARESQQLAADLNSSVKPATGASKAADAGLPVSNETRSLDRPRRPNKAGGTSASKTAQDESAPGDEAKSQKKPKTYVPNDL